MKTIVPSIFLALITGLATNLCHAQVAESMLIPFENNGLWGYMNFDKEIIVQPEYEEAHPTYHLRGRVKKKGKYGFIDNAGALIIKCKYDEADDFEYGIARVKKREEVKYIRSNGKINKVITGGCGTHSNCFKPRLNSEVVFQDEFGKYGFITMKRSVDKNDISIFLPDTIQAQFDNAIPINSELMFVESDGLLSFINSADFHAGADHVISTLDFKYEDFLFFDCEICTDGKDRFIGVKQNGLWGIFEIYHTLELVTEFKYLSVSALSRGYGLVKIDKERYGFID